MKTSSSRRFDYTEQEMAEAFLAMLRSREGLPGIGPFDGVYREVNCRQGRPDFIAIRDKGVNHAFKPIAPTGVVGPAILSLLKPKAPRTLHYLVSHSEFSEKSIRRSIRQLFSSGQVERTATGAYRLTGLLAGRGPEIWAFELKLDNHKRAIFQAQQCRAYANRAVIVVPPGQEKSYARYSSTLSRWGIALATFDPFEGVFHLTRRGRNIDTICPQHRLYALSRIGVMS